MSEPLLTAAMFSSALVSAFTTMGCEAGVSRALQGVALQRLSYGRLDPNHDIARAAHLAQLNAAIVLLGRARDAEPKTDSYNGAPIIPHATAKPYDAAISELRRLAGKIEKTSPEQFAAGFPAGAHAAVEDAARYLLAAERGEAQPPHAALSRATLDLVVKLGKWTSPPPCLEAAFEDFPAVFAASISALFKSPQFDAFYRIWLVLKAEATDATVGEIRAVVLDLSARDEERRRDAALVAGGSEKLGAFEGSLGRIEATLDRVEDTTRKTLQTAESIDARLAEMDARGLSERERGLLERDIALLRREKGFTEKLVARFLKSILDDDVPPEKFEDALALAVQRYQAAVAELARRSNLPHDLEAARAAALAAANDGDLDRAEAILVRLRADIRERREQSQREEAAIAAEQAALVAATDVRRAAALFEEAADLLPPGDLDEAHAQLMHAADAIQEVGDRLGDNAALAQAVRLYRRALDKAPRGAFAENWAGTQNNLGIALQTLGARTDDRGALQAARRRLSRRPRGAHPRPRPARLGRDPEQSRERALDARRAHRRPRRPPGSRRRLSRRP